VDKPFVLLADDSEATCTLITALLQSEFVVETAGDGNEAIEKLRSRQYAAILLDLRMPVVDGYAVLDFVTSERPELLSRILVVTASLAEREMQRLSNYAVCAVIPKPFEVDMLFHAVRQCAGDENVTPSIRSPFIASGMLLLLAAEVLRRV
jgi:CheY-like chemotaxis protein